MKWNSGFSAVLMLSVAAIAMAQPDDDSLDSMTAFGQQYESAWDLYSALEAAAEGGQPLAWDNLPDWSGIHTRGRGGGTEWSGQLLPACKRCQDSNRAQDAWDARARVRPEPASDEQRTPQPRHFHRTRTRGRSARRGQRSTRR